MQRVSGSAGVRVGERGGGSGAVVSGYSAVLSVGSKSVVWIGIHARDVSILCDLFCSSDCIVCFGCEEF